MSMRLREVDPPATMPIGFLEDNFADLALKKAAHSVEGACLAAAQIRDAYPDSPEAKELFRNTCSFAVAKRSQLKPPPFPGGQREPIAHQQWRARTLNAFVWHKVQTREEYPRKEMIDDFHAIFIGGSSLNYGFARSHVLEPKRQELFAQGGLSPRQYEALRVSRRVAEQYTMRPRGLVRAVRQALGR